MSDSNNVDIEKGNVDDKFKTVANNVVRTSLNWRNSVKRTPICFRPIYLEDVEDSSSEDDAGKDDEEIDIGRIIRKSQGVPSEIIRFNTKLLQCVKSNTPSSVKDCIENGASPDATCQMQNISVCHLAAYHGSDRILKELIRYGGNPIRMDVKGRTPLHYSAWKGTSNCLRILVEYYIKDKCINSSIGTGDDINAMWADSNDHNCIGLAISTRNIPCYKTALEVALGQLNFECVRILLDAGARLCTCSDAQSKRDAKFCLATINSCGSTIKKNDYSNQKFLETLQVVLLHGRRMTGKKREVCTKYYKPNDNQLPAIHKAVIMDSDEMVKLLLDAGFSPMQYDQNLQTPLHYSVIYRKMAPLKTLSNANGLVIGTLYSALNLSITKDWLAGVVIIIKQLINKNLHIDQPDELEDTVLHLAAKRGNHVVVRNLIEIFRHFKLSIDQVNKAGHTPLYESVRAGHALCVREFLHQGAVLTTNGDTELHEAARNGDHSVLEQLLETTALVENSSTFINARDTYGVTPLHWAAHKNSVECFNRLISAGADIDLPASEGAYEGFTVLHMAAFNDSVDIVNHILKLHPKMINERDVHQKLPFHIAVLHGHRDACSLFISMGADLSDILPIETKPNTSMELMSSWQNAVDYIENLFDMYILSNDYKIAEKQREITLNYDMFISDNEGELPQRMKVIEAIFGNDLGFDQLILHPLVESYLSLEWSRLRSTFAVIVFIHAIHLFFLTALVIDIYDDYIVNEMWKKCVWASLSIIIIMELLLLSFSKSLIYLKKLEWLQKILSVGLSIWFLLDFHIDSKREMSRIIAAVTVLTAWVQFSLQFSRLTGGFSYRIFEKVALRAAKVLLMFGWFLVIGFGLAFWILFQENSPFDTWGDSIIKTIVMMTSEFDYETLFDDRPFDPLWTISRLLFLTFILFISIVMMNLLLTLAISDTEDLKAEGQKQRLLEKVYFLGMLDGFTIKLVCRILPKFLNNRIYKMQLREMTLYPGRIGASKTPHYLSERVAARVFHYCSEKEKPEEKILDDMAHKINRIDNNSKDIRNLNESLEVHLKELTKKVDRLSTMKKAKYNKTNKLRWTFSTGRKTWKRNT